MKKVLLGTTAIIGASMFALPAVAADPIKLGLGGYHNVMFGANLAEEDSHLTSDQGGADNKGELDVLLNQDTEIFFTGETELENGLTFGFVTQLEMDSVGTNATKDESFMYISGGFGRVLIGDDDGAIDQSNVAAPGVSMFSATAENSMIDGVDGGMSGLGNMGTQGALSLAGDDSGAFYRSPRIAGFRGHVSYKATDSAERIGLDDGFQARSTDGRDDIWGFGLDYQNSFGGFDVAVGAGYETANATGNSNNATNSQRHSDVDVYAAGIQVGFAGVRFGGGYGLASGNHGYGNKGYLTGVNDAGNGTGGYAAATTTQAQYSDADVQLWNVGASYGIGPVNVGVTYARVDMDDYDNGAGLAIDGGSHSAFAVDSRYAMGPGINFDAGIQWNSDEANVAKGTGADASYENVALGMGFALSF